jgi:pyruvate formate lyase activating enzyme
MIHERQTPLVVDVKRHSLEDGPGIRSVVFFKGCLMDCVFCQNPETKDHNQEIAFYDGECVHCGKCSDVCDHEAIDLEMPGRIDRDKCVRCGKCAEACPGGGLRLIGRFLPVESLAEILLRDAAFYKHSGGGVTLSGGECAIHPDYLERLLISLKARGIHTAVQTAGYFDYDRFVEKILPYIDVVYFDLKFADARVHKKYTGKHNRKIIGNLRRLMSEGKPVYPRIPLIPDITATMENLTDIVEILHDAGADNVSLLPYNPMGSDMAVRLGRAGSSLSGSFMSPEGEKKVYDMFGKILQARQYSAASLRTYSPKPRVNGNDHFLPPHSGHLRHMARSHSRDQGM